MDNTSYTIRVPKRWARLSLVVVVTALIVAPLSAWAGHNFNDVPNDNTFHSNIEWLAENDVTRGCNPPLNNLFCPEDNVTREQMSAFMQRLAQTFGVASDEVLDFGSTVNITSSTRTEVASVSVTPKAEAHVLLNAHVTIEKPATSDGRYDVQVRRGSCEGELIARGWFRGNGDHVSGFAAVTVPATGADVVSSNTTYKLCVAKNSGADPNATVNMRGLTASWMPTS